MLLQHSMRGIHLLTAQALEVADAGVLVHVLLDAVRVVRAVRAHGARKHAVPTAQEVGAVRGNVRAFQRPRFSGRKSNRHHVVEELENER